MPLLAVAKNLKLSSLRNLKITVISERRSRFSHILEPKPDFVDEVVRINSGKLRRYHDDSWLKRVFDFKTNFLNLRDIILLLAGIIEAAVLIIRTRPDVIFIKGGYVGVPVGICAWILRVPYITHDSDTCPGLTNRIIGPGARHNAVGMKQGHYGYPKSKTVYVGISISDEYHKLNTGIGRQKANFGQPRGHKMILILGGSSGAQKLDEIVKDALKIILKEDSKIFVIHQVSAGNIGQYNDWPEQIRNKIRTETFLKPLAPYVLAADLVVSRAGATIIAELASLHKPVIVVPHPGLSAGHQLANARMLKNSNAAVVIQQNSETASQQLASNIKDLLASETKSVQLGKHLSDLFDTSATQKIGDLILKTAEYAEKK